MEVYFFVTIHIILIFSLNKNTACSTRIDSKVLKVISFFTDDKKMIELQINVSIHCHQQFFVSRVIQLLIFAQFIWFTWNRSTIWCGTFGWLVVTKTYSVVIVGYTSLGFRTRIIIITRICTIILNA